MDKTHEQCLSCPVGLVCIVDKSAFEGQYICAGCGKQFVDKNIYRESIFADEHVDTIAIEIGERDCLLEHKGAGSRFGEWEVMCDTCHGVSARRQIDG